MCPRLSCSPSIPIPRTIDFNDDTSTEYRVSSDKQGCRGWRFFALSHCLLRTSNANNGRPVRTTFYGPESNAVLVVINLARYWYESERQQIPHFLPLPIHHPLLPKRFGGTEFWVPVCLHRCAPLILGPRFSTPPAPILPAPPAVLEHLRSHLVALAGLLLPATDDLTTDVSRRSDQPQQIHTTALPPLHITALALLSIHFRKPSDLESVLHIHLFVSIVDFHRQFVT